MKESSVHHETKGTPMKFWHGTRLRTSWLRLRGSASGRRSDAWIRPFFCEGCQRAHGSRIIRFKVGDCLFCTRTYLTLSAVVRCIFMSKDSELMPERPQTNEAIPDEAAAPSMPTPTRWESISSREPVSWLTSTRNAHQAYVSVPFRFQRHPTAKFSHGQIVYGPKCLLL